MLNINEALAIANNHCDGGEVINYCEEFPNFFLFSKKEVDKSRSLGGLHIFVAKEDGRVFYSVPEILKVLGENIFDNEKLKEGFLEEYIKAD